MFSWIKSFKHPFAIYAEFETFSVKYDGNDNNPHKSFTTEVIKHKAYVLAMFIKYAYDDNEKKVAVLMMIVLINFVKH